MKTKTQIIEVRHHITHEMIKVIKRVIWGESVERFFLSGIPHYKPLLFCRYNKMRVLVKSDAGDVSDPFRRDESYSKSFYIEVVPM